MYINSDPFMSEGILYPVSPKPTEEEQNSSAGVGAVEKSREQDEKPVIKEPEKTGKQKKDSVELSEEAKEKASSKAHKLTEDEQKEVEELQDRDKEVRTHEQAHVAAGGAYIRGGASFSYQNGPDGKRYAVGGSVDIDTSPVSGDPAATIAKMNAVRAAALAPAEPSGQDQNVASAATQKMVEAQQELQEQKQAKLAEENEKVAPESKKPSEPVQKKEDAQEIEEKEITPYEQHSESLKAVTGGVVDIVA